MLARMALVSLLAIALAGCDPAPGPAPTAQALGAAHGLPPSLAGKLVAREALSGDEVDRVLRIAAPELVALLVANPVVTPEQLAAWARHPDDAVRQAVAAQSRTPVASLRALHQAGTGHPINGVLAANPSTPADLLVDMRNKGEAGDVSLASNPALPQALMRDIARRGDELALMRLASNPSLPADLRARLIKGER